MESTMTPRGSSPFSKVSNKKSRRLSIANESHVYQIGAEVGRGAFSLVYQAFNVETGDFLAIKRLPLNTASASDIASMQAEIELLQRLDHPNIVKYVDMIKSHEHLNIVLEYMEKGSLANIIQKYGLLSESLIVKYISQVLCGLDYLHDQGVLHRDIKGANILATKGGCVKLADFGLASKMNKVQGNDFVGTPYWMAPEIIEMNSPTIGCDIWSVGCTIIELFTGKPPYYDLTTMTALFRIVQDQHPSLPEGVSAEMADFLMICFCKQPSLRGTAGKLLSHKWLNSTNLATSSTISNSRTSANNDNTTEANDTHNTDVDGVSLQLNCGTAVTNNIAKSISDSKLLSIEAAITASNKISYQLIQGCASSILGLETLQSELRDEEYCIPALEVGFKKQYTSREVDQRIACSIEIYDIIQSIVDTSGKNDKEIVGKCCQIIRLLHVFSGQRIFFLNNYGIGPLLDLMKYCERRYSDISNHSRYQILYTINTIVEDNVHAYEMLSSFGFMACLLKFTGSIVAEAMSLANDDKPSSVILSYFQFSPSRSQAPVEADSYLQSALEEAAQCLYHMSISSELGLQMLIGAGGLPVIVDMIHLASMKMDRSDSLPSDISSQVGLKCISMIVSRRKGSVRDIYRIFKRLNLFTYMCDLLEYSNSSYASSVTAHAKSYMAFITSIFLEFSEHTNFQLEVLDIWYSEDSRALRCIIAIVQRTIDLLHSNTDAAATTTASGSGDGCGCGCGSSSSSSSSGCSNSSSSSSSNSSSSSVMTESVLCLLSIARNCLLVVTNLSIEPKLACDIDEAGALELLIPVLYTQYYSHFQQYILTIVFNMCRFSKQRLQKAASTGIIRYIQGIISNSEKCPIHTDMYRLRTIAVPILIDLAYASDVTRGEMRKTNCISTLLMLLEDSRWHVSAFHALAECFNSKSITFTECEGSSIIALICFLRSASDDVTSAIYKPLLDMMCYSTVLCQSLASSDLYVLSLIQRIHVNQDAVFLLSSLHVLQLLIASHSKPSQFILDHSLSTLVKAFAASDSRVLLHQVANKLLSDFKKYMLLSTAT